MCQRPLPIVLWYRHHIIPLGVALVSPHSFASQTSNNLPPIPLLCKPRLLYKPLLSSTHSRKPLTLPPKPREFLASLPIRPVLLGRVRSNISTPRVLAQISRFWQRLWDALVGHQLPELLLLRLGKGPPDARLEESVACVGGSLVRGHTTEALGVLEDLEWSRGQVFGFALGGYGGVWRWLAELHCGQRRKIVVGAEDGLVFTFFGGFRGRGMRGRGFDLRGHDLALKGFCLGGRLREGSRKCQPRVVRTILTSRTARDGMNNIKAGKNGLMTFRNLKRYGPHYYIGYISSCFLTLNLSSLESPSSTMSSQS